MFTLDQSRKHLKKCKSNLPTTHNFTYLRYWGKVDFSHADLYLPDVAGVYAVTGKKEREIIYVGVSNNLKDRLSGHHKFYEFLREGAAYVRYLPLEEGLNRKERELIEAAYIHTLHPYLNLNLPIAFGVKDLLSYQE